MEAITRKNASLLFPGITQIENEFEPGDVVAIVSPEGTEIARGIANYSSADATRLMGRQSADIERLASTRNYDAFVTRDNIAFTAKNHE
jgi:glutamate 5-kinase